MSNSHKNSNFNKDIVKIDNNNNQTNSHSNILTSNMSISKSSKITDESKDYSININTNKLSKSKNVKFQDGETSKESNLYKSSKIRSKDDSIKDYQIPKPKRNHVETLVKDYFYAKDAVKNGSPSKNLDNEIYDLSYLIQSIDESKNHN